MKFKKRKQQTKTFGYQRTAAGLEAKKQISLLRDIFFLALPISIDGPGKVRQFLTVDSLRTYFLASDDLQISLALI